MSRIEDKVTELTSVISDIGNGVTGLEGDVKTLDDKIAALQAASTGEMTPEQEAAMNAVIDAAKAVRDRVTALDALTPAAEPVPEPNPTPEPNPEGQA